MRRQACQKGPNAPVVRTEVVPPVRDAVGLVEDNQRGVCCQVRQDLIAEHRVVETLGGDQEDIHLAGAHLGLDRCPLGDIG